MFTLDLYPLLLYLEFPNLYKRWSHLNAVSGLPLGEENDVLWFILLKGDNNTAPLITLLMRAGAQEHITLF